MVFEPLELIDRLAALVPPPRFHTVRYHGVLASRSKHRAQVVPKVTEAVARPLCDARSYSPGKSTKTHRTGSRSRSSDPVPRPTRSATSTETASAQPDSAPASRDSVTTRSSRPSSYYSWPELMKRVFEIDVLQCPRCRASPMRILAAIHPPVTTQAILKSLGLPARAPPIAPARPMSPDWWVAEPSASRYRDSRTGLPAA